MEILEAIVNIGKGLLIFTEIFLLFLLTKIAINYLNKQHDAEPNDEINHGNQSESYSIEESIPHYEE